MLLASLGAIFTAAGVGEVISELVAKVIPKGNVNLGIIIFSELLRSFQKKQAQESRNANEFYIGDILDYMEKNYMNCSLKEVAEHFGYKPSYLSRMIHRQVGKSFISIIQEIKLNHASLLLRNSTLPVEQIIQQVGYKNLSFFYKIFYEKFALSPNDYRQSIS